MGKVTAVQFFLTGLIAPVLGPTVVASVSDGFFSGPGALARSMSLVCAVYSAISLLGLLAVLRSLKAEEIQPERVVPARRAQHR